MNRRRYLGRGGAFAVGLVAGCLRAPGASTQAVYPDYAWEQLERADAIPSPEIFMRDRVFIPLVTGVQPDTEVAFVNLDPEAHTVTMPLVDIDVTVPAEGRYSVTFDEEGVYDFVCRFHPPDMLGRLFVIDAPLRR